MVTVFCLLVSHGGLWLMAASFRLLVRGLRGFKRLPRRERWVWVPGDTLDQAVTETLARGSGATTGHGPLKSVVESADM